METLSVATRVKVTVCDCALVVNETLVSSALKLVIDGSTLSDFLIVNVIFEVLVFFLSGCKNKKDN